MTRLETAISKEVDGLVLGQSSVLPDTLLSELRRLGLSEKEVGHASTELPRRVRARLPYHQHSYGIRHGVKINAFDKPEQRPRHRVFRPLANKKAQAFESTDQVFRTARIVAHAIRTFGDQKKGLAWLRAENAALKSRRPLDLIKSDAGAYAVEEVLYRIEFGMFS